MSRTLSVTPGVGPLSNVRVTFFTISFVVSEAFG
jgi:hypothetical protein